MSIRMASSKRQQGIALMVVMIAVFVLSVLAGAFAYAMKVETKLAMNSNQEAYDVYQCGQSGVAFRMFLMSLYNSAPSVNAFQKWNGGPGDEFDTNGVLADIIVDEQGRVQFPGWESPPFTSKCTDLSSRININTADERVLQQALMLAGVDGGEIDAITSAILDWIDPDENTHINGAESSYYQSLDPPHYAKNGPMDDLSELLLVRGITPEMYEGTDSSESVEKPQSLSQFQRRDPFGRMMPGQIQRIGLKNIFTTFSAGKKININTTTEQVLQAIGFDEAMAADLIRQRNEAPFRRGDLPSRVPQQYKGVIDGYIEYGGSIFEVEVTPIAGLKRTYHAIIGPGQRPGEMQVFSFYWKESEEGQGQPSEN